MFRIRICIKNRDQNLSGLNWTCNLLILNYCYRCEKQLHVATDPFVCDCCELIKLLLCYSWHATNLLGITRQCFSATTAGTHSWIDKIFFCTSPPTWPTYKSNITNNFASKAGAAEFHAPGTRLVRTSANPRPGLKINPMFYFRHFYLPV